MADYVSNCPISRPIKVPGWSPDNDFSGLMWSHEHGLMFNPVGEFIPLKLPSPRSSR